MPFSKNLFRSHTAASLAIAPHIRNRRGHVAPRNTSVYYVRTCVVRHIVEFKREMARLIVLRYWIFIRNCATSIGTIRPWLWSYKNKKRRSLHSYSAKTYTKQPWKYLSCTIRVLKAMRCRICTVGATFIRSTGGCLARFGGSGWDQWH